MKKNIRAITAITGIGLLKKGQLNRLGHGPEMLGTALTLCTKQALKDSRIQLPLIRRQASTTGFFSCVDEGIDAIKRQFYQDGLKYGLHQTNPALFPFTIPNAAAGITLINLKLPISSYTFSDAALSSTSAVYCAQELLKSRKLKLAIIAGVSSTDKRMVADPNHIVYADSSAAIILETCILNNPRVYAELLETKIMNFRNTIPRKKEKLLEELILSVSGGFMKERSSPPYWLISTPYDKDMVVKIVKRYHRRFGCLPKLIYTPGLSGFSPSVAQILSLAHLLLAKRKRAKHAGFRQMAVVIGIDPRGKAACFSLRF